MYTLNTEDTTRYSLSKCEKSPILACKWEVPPPTPINPYFGQNAQKMDHFLEAKPYIHLYKTSFLDWKWFLEVSWGQKWARESIVSLYHYRDLKGSSKNKIWLVQMKKNCENLVEKMSFDQKNWSHQVSANFDWSLLKNMCKISSSERIPLASSYWLQNVPTYVPMFPYISTYIPSYVLYVLPDASFLCVPFHVLSFVGHGDTCVCHSPPMPVISPSVSWHGNIGGT